MSNRQFQTLRQAGISLSGMRPRFATARNEGNLTNPSSDFLAAILGATGPLGAKVNEVTALGVSTVFACVHYIAKTVSTLPLELYVQQGDRRRIAQGHPVRRVMRVRPNAIMTPCDVRYSLAWNQALWGNAYAQLVFNRSGRVAEIYPLKSRNVTMDLVNGFPEYTVTSDRRAEKLGFDRVLHLRGMTADGLKGMGPLSLVQNLIGLAQALEQNASSFFANGSRPGLIYTTPPDVTLSEQQKQSISEQLSKAYQGVESFFRTVIADGGGKFEMMRANNENSQFDEIAKRTHQQICQAFGVPPHKVGILDNATFSNIEEQQIQAIADLIGPWCVSWEQAFAGALLLPDEQDNHYWKHNLNGLLRGDVVKRTQAQSSWLQNGVLSINEVRALEDLDPVDGGDTHVRQLNMIDINAPATAPAPAPTQNAA